MTPEFNQHWQKIAFITALSSRHQGNYALFCEAIEAPEQAQQFNKVLNKVWEYLVGQLTSMKNLEKALLQLEEITPEPTDYDYYGVYPALDACLLLTSALQMILDDSIDDVADASPLSLATVKQFVALSEQLDEDDPTLMAHELYVSEVEFQDQTLQLLSKGENQKIETIKALRKTLSGYEYSNLGIAS